MINIFKELNLLGYLYEVLEFNARFIEYLTKWYS